MSLQKISGPGGIIAKSLNTPMTRRQFLAMSGTLVLAVFGLPNLLAIVMKHTNNTAPQSLMVQPDQGFGSRKFGV